MFFFFFFKKERFASLFALMSKSVELSSIFSNGSFSDAELNFPGCQSTLSHQLPLHSFPQNSSRQPGDSNDISDPPVGTTLCSRQFLKPSAGMNHIFCSNYKAREKGLSHNWWWANCPSSGNGAARSFKWTASWGRTMMFAQSEKKKRLWTFKKTRLSLFLH